MNKRFKFSRGKRAWGLSVLLAFSIGISTISSLLVPQKVHAVEGKSPFQDPEYIQDRAILNNEVSTIRPRPKKLALDKILEWEAKDDIYDLIHKASVPLQSRVRGAKVNPLANEKVKVQSLAYLTSASEGHSAVGRGDEGFKIYAFDNWQLLDEMVFWDGPIPNPEVVDAAHRNGVPILGTLFFNWSMSAEDQEVVKYTLQEDSEGSNTFPAARKYAEIAKYYGFDGYFFNQETAMEQKIYTDKFVAFLKYMKSYAESISWPIQVSWYDAMSNDGGRYHGNAVDPYNNVFMDKDDNGNAFVDQFFMNFGWSRDRVSTTVEEMNKLGRDPYDAYAGWELQQGGAYKTYQKVDDLVDSTTRQARLSLGLFVPDTILGMSADGEDYHKQEQKFWVGYTNNPVTADDAQAWSGIARFATDKTAITSLPFTTDFNTGHGRAWYINGEKSLAEEWNGRSIQDIMPTWRWWIENDNASISGDYDFSQAYNGGTSLRFSGSLSSVGKSEIMLYSTYLDISADTEVELITRENQDVNLELGIATSQDYSQVTYFPLNKEGQDWQKSTVSLADLAGSKAYAIKLRINGADVNDYALNLGKLSIYNDKIKPSAATNPQVDKTMFVNSTTAEAIIHVDPVANAKAYEVYQEVNGQWEIINSTSSNYIYLPRVSRDALQNTGSNNSNLKVVVVGGNGERSEELVMPFDWGMDVEDATEAQVKPDNIMPFAKIISAPSSGNSEVADNILSGTINNTADKWFYPGPAVAEVRLDKPRTVRSWAIDHAGAGGESVNDGLMNTKDFDIYYKDMETGDWKLAASVRNNIEHVSEGVFEEGITAQDWKLDVINPDNGSPWGGLRIYNWRMYEEIYNATANVPMSHANAIAVAPELYNLTFAKGEPGAKLTVYKDREMTEELLSGTIADDGIVIFQNVSIPGESGMLYYVSQAEGKDASNMLNLKYVKDDATVEILDMTVDADDMQKNYMQGEELNLADASVEVKYLDKEGVEQVETLSFTNSHVSVSGYDKDKLGEQVLEVNVNSQLAGTITVQVLTEEEANQLPLEDLKFATEPLKVYKVGTIEEGVDFPRANNGSLKAIAEGKLELEPIALDAVDSNDEYLVEITGFDKNKIGTQTVSFSYNGKTVNLDVTVEGANKEYLEQAIAMAEAKFTDEVKQELPKKFVEDSTALLEEAKAVFADELARQETVDEMTKKLDDFDKDITLVRSFVEDLSKTSCGKLSLSQEMLREDKLMIYNPALMLDNSDDSYTEIYTWDSHIPENAVVQIHLPIPVKLCRVRFLQEEYYKFADATIQYSEDGITWVDLARISSDLEVDQEVDVIASDIRILNNVGVDTYGININDFSLYGQSIPEYTVNEVQPVEVDYATSEEDALAALPETVTVLSLDGETSEASADWSFDEAYDPNVAGEKSVTAIVTLPDGSTTEVKTSIVVKPEETQPSETTTEPSETTGETTEPSESSSETTEPSETSSETTEPSETSSETTEPSESSSETTEPSESSSETTEPSESSSETTEPSESSSETTEPSETSSETTEPSESSSETTEPSETSSQNEPTTTEKPSETTAEVVKESLKFIAADTRVRLQDTAEFRINSNPESFIGLEIDGKDINPSLYSIEKGSTIITLSNELIRQLGVGKHVLTVKYLESELYYGGEISTAFEIVGEQEAPSTSDKASEKIDSNKTTKTDEVTKTGQSLVPMFVAFALISFAVVLLVQVRKRLFDLE